VKGRPAFDMVKIRAAATAAGINIAEFETVGAATDRLAIQVTGTIPPRDLSSTESKGQ
jgi:hypothetical protein